MTVDIIDDLVMIIPVEKGMIAPVFLVFVVHVLSVLHVVKTSEDVWINVQKELVYYLVHALLDLKLRHVADVLDVVRRMIILNGINKNMTVMIVVLVN